MTPHELQLIANLLKRFAVDLSNAGTNDMPESDWEGIPPEARKEISRAIGRYIDDENEDWHPENDQWAAEMLAEKIENSISFIPEENFPK